MTTTEHTPSPWHHRESKFDSSVWEIIADYCESPLAEVPRWEDEEGNASEEAKANLAVMTAAPLLLAACRMIVSRWERGDLAEAARACQAAVELATGDSPPWDITDAERPRPSADIDIHALLGKRRQIASVWIIEDVQSIRPDLTDQQAWEVLEAAERYEDAIPEQLLTDISPLHRNGKMEPFQPVSVSYPTYRGSPSNRGRRKPVLLVYSVD